MIMIDKIINHSEVDTITSLAIKEDNIFLENNIFQSSGLIENMAQSAAARFGIEANLKGKKPAFGYIASIKNMTVKRLPIKGDIILTKVIQTNQINNIIVIQAETKKDNIVVSNCELKVFIER